MNGSDFPVPEKAQRVRSGTSPELPISIIQSDSDLKRHSTPACDGDLTATGNLMLSWASGLSWCKQAIERHELAHHTTFDVIAFSRPDLIFWMPILPPWSAWNWRETALLNCGQNRRGRDNFCIDVAWIAPRRTGLQILGVLDAHQRCNKSGVDVRICCRNEYLMFYAAQPFTPAKATLINPFITPANMDVARSAADVQQHNKRYRADAGNARDLRNVTAEVAECETLDGVELAGGVVRVRDATST